MNIDKVNLKINRNACSALKRQQTSFTSAIPTTVIEKELNKYNSGTLRCIDKFKKNIGEFQDICINAMGTGFLAPVFIKYNPLSKTDEDTRTYSAWRQPLSAVFAIITQGFITIPIASKIVNMANEGSLSIDCNQTLFKDEKYVRKQIKKANPNLTPEQLYHRTLEYMDNQKKKLLTMLKKDNAIYFNIAGSSKPHKMEAEKYKKLLERTVEDMRSYEAAELKRCTTEKTEKRIARSEFYRTNNEIANNLIADMRNAITNKKDIGEIDKYLKGKIKELKSRKADQQLIDMVIETRYRTKADKEIVLNKIEKMQGHINKYKNVSSKEEVIRLVKESIAERISSHSEAIGFLDDVQKAIGEGKTVSQINEMFINKTEELKLAGKKFRLDDKKFPQEVAKKLKALTNTHVAGLNRIATLIGALATLPLSCSLLNWVYPRFMDAVFPKLSSKKHTNESKELVEKATGNGKVQ